MKRRSSNHRRTSKRKRGRSRAHAASIADEPECEIRRGDEWVTITISEALRVSNDVDMRCIECHGRVIPMPTYKSGTPKHFEHRVLHRGCSTKRRTFSGTRSRHPEALE